MTKKLLISEKFQEKKIFCMENNQIIDFFFQPADYKNSMKFSEGSIYKGKVVKILEGLDASFIDIGQGKAVFVHAIDLYKPNKEEMKSFSLEVTKKQYSVADDVSRVSEELKKLKQYIKPIAHYIQLNQEVLVQIDKEPISTKGPKGTGHISFIGKYIILYPNLGISYISDRISSLEERIRLKSLITSFAYNDYGYIIKNNAQDVSLDLLQQDYFSLVEDWKRVQKAFDDKEKTLLYKGDSFVEKTIKEYSSFEIYTDSKNVLKELKKRYPVTFLESEEMFEKFELRPFLNNLLKSHIVSPTGVSINIEQTEALVSIDVNSGKFFKKTTKETIFETNKEAALMIADNLKWRNLGGLIVVDFIDMDDPLERKELERLFYEKIQEDRSKVSFLPISEYGLMQIIRKRKSDNFYRMTTQVCLACQGNGFVKNFEYLSQEVLEKLSTLLTNSSKNLEVRLSSNLYYYFIKKKKNFLEKLEKKFSAKMTITLDSALCFDSFFIDKKE
jgi:ribonuclease G